MHHNKPQLKSAFLCLVLTGEWLSQKRLHAGTWQQYRTAHPDMETTAPAGMVMTACRARYVTAAACSCRITHISMHSVSTGSSKKVFM